MTKNTHILSGKNENSMKRCVSRQPKNLKCVKDKHLKNTAVLHNCAEQNAKLPKHNYQVQEWRDATIT